MPRLGLVVIGYIWVLAFILAISHQYLYRFVLAPEVAKWAPTRPSDLFTPFQTQVHSIVGIPDFLTISTPFQTKVHSIVTSPGIAWPRVGCLRPPLGTSFHSSHKSSISQSICMGTPRLSDLFTPFQTHVHSIVAFIGFSSPKAGCHRLPLGTSFHSSHKPSISLSICTGTSSCKVGTTDFMTFSTPFQTELHYIVPRPRIPRLSLGVVGYFLLLAFILAVSRQYRNRFVP